MDFYRARFLRIIKEDYLGATLNYFTLLGGERVYTNLTSYTKYLVHLLPPYMGLSEFLFKLQ